MIYILIAFVVLVLLLVYGCCVVSSKCEQEQAIWCYNCKNQQCKNGCKWTEGSKGCKEYRRCEDGR